jgi:hypothetical protein
MNMILPRRFAAPVLAARHGAAAGVNGGYFRTTGTYTGEPSGLMAFGARVWSEPSPRRTALAVTNAGGRVRAVVAAVDFTASIAAGERPVSDALLVLIR